MMFISKKAAAGGAGITPDFLGGANSGNSTAGGSDTVSVDMSGHNGTDDVIVMIGAIGNPGISITDVTLDGNAYETLVTQTNSGTDGPLCAYAIFGATSFASSSDCVVTYSGSGKDCGVAAYGIPADSTVATITSSAESARTGSTLSGNVSDGDGVLACQQQKNGSASAWTGLTEDYEADIRGNEWFTAASAGDVAAATPMTITVDGSNTETAGISVKVS